MDCENNQTLNGILMPLIHAHFLRAQYHLEKVGLHPGQTKLLLMLRKSNGLSQREICDKLGVKPSTITVMIKRMEKTELIERQSDDNDQRKSRIFVTEKGKKICNLIDEINIQMEKECFENFNEEEKAEAKKLLTKMKDNLRIVNHKK